mgnify:FL=1
MKSTPNTRSMKASSRIPEMQGSNLGENEPQPQPEPEYEFDQRIAR